MCFLEVKKTCVNVFDVGLLPKFIENLLKSKIWSVVLRPNETALSSYPPVLV